VSTRTGESFPFDRVGEFSPGGDSLEVRIGGARHARPGSGGGLIERFADFLPFEDSLQLLSLGEGNTPLLAAGKGIDTHTGARGVLLKDETRNPTWSFKDRGSLMCVTMARELGERVTATVSTGNMGHSISAYAARAGLNAIVFVPAFAPREKLLAMTIHGATVLVIEAPEYSLMKDVVLGLADEFSLRIVSGNGPVRVEGYKLEAFEIWEQLLGNAPDYIAVPTSACGHIRGIHKGWRELHAAGLVSRLPKMIVVQAANNAPIVTAIKRGLETVVPFTNIHTIAEAITAGNPKGGDEIIAKARQYGWLAEDVTEDEIVESQRQLARAGFFVEPASATSVAALQKLVAAGKLDPEARTVLMLTGSGLKDTGVLTRHPATMREVKLSDVREVLKRLMDGESTRLEG
jgi:threonine synthase